MVGFWWWMELLCYLPFQGFHSSGMGGMSQPQVVIRAVKRKRRGLRPNDPGMGCSTQPQGSEGREGARDLRRSPEEEDLPAKEMHRGAPEAESGGRRA